MLISFALPRPSCHAHVNSPCFQSFQALKRGYLGPMLPLQAHRLMQDDLILCELDVLPVLSVQNLRGADGDICSALLKQS